ncbi:hypothetical protein Q5Y75_11240 [Ruegeria sp. 2205SS24-7]|uniref:hypothetical protein n=1 Tax=Ruegeria discodermiae TaxID=3064389 RepID=UPI0027409412|nr:hypothetical protein [Ruegeria sp. 2205SS24-7]MDP5217795.1 hypothetical protein [Ruegeria sp. 2205SS24-7]
MEEFQYHHRSRSWRALAILGAIYALLLVGVVTIDLVWWIGALAVLCTLPAVYEFFTDRRAGLTLSAQELRWFTGTLTRDVPLDDIKIVRFDTRWDLSVRVTLILQNDKKLRLPHECLPPHRDFETRLKQAGLHVDRHHFVVF